MYSTGSVLGATTVVAGAVALPNTSGNTVGQFLAYTAIVIGVCALISRVVVAVIKKQSR